MYKTEDIEVFPIFIPHQGCPFQCIYCNQKMITNSKSPNLQKINTKIYHFIKNNTNKRKEIAFFGGTFTSLPKNKMDYYLNFTEKFKKSIYGIRISTRPDSIDKETLSYLKKNKVKTIELGIQSFDDTVLKKTQRGYNSQSAIESSILIKKSEFNLGIQLMPGLPGDDKRTFLKTIQITKDIKPDYVRIYPTIVLKSTKLEDLYKKGNYTPLNLDQAVSWSTLAVNSLEREQIKVIKIGLHSDIEINKDNITTGPYHPAFGEMVKANIMIKDIVKNYTAKNTIHISSKAISLFKGHNNIYLKKLKRKLNLINLPIKLDNNLPKNKYYLSKDKPNKNW